MPLEFRKQCDGSPRDGGCGALEVNGNQSRVKPGVKIGGAGPLLANGGTMLGHFLIALVAALAVSASVFAAPVPVPGDMPIAVDCLRPGNANVFPMTGTWRFRLEHGASPAVKGELPADTPVPDFATPDASDAGWTNILVPANWEIEGFSIPTYQERFGNLSDDIGLYRRWVDVPASFAGQTVLWHFDGVYDGAEVFVNGQRVGYHESGFTAFDMDVTKALKPGQRNLMAVRVYKTTSSSNLDRGSFWCLGGIYRENYLVALPPLHVEDVTVVTDLDDHYKDATLKSTVRVAGPAGARFILTCELYSLDGAKIALPAMSQAGDIGADGSALAALTAPVDAPKLWSAEKPNLYYVFYRLSEGDQTVVERVQERIGFRKLEIKGGVFMVNGVPVKMAGVCRHEEFSPYGHALNEDCWKTDIILMKAANINAVRTAHYNHAERFMELCDEAGFYVLDEVPFCWVNTELNNTNRLWAYLSRSKETLDRDKNRACAAVWCCGNENGYGANAQASFDYMKAHDPTRPALISQQGPGPNPKTDFDDYHYPSVPSLKAMITSPNRAKYPVIVTEFSGAQDAWGQALADNWAVIWPADAITGAFIWEWQDQGQADKFPERWSVHSPDAPAADATPGAAPPISGIPTANTTTGMRPAGGGGAVTADRQTKLMPYWNLKMVYSPVNTTAREVDLVAGQCVVPIQNRYSFTDLSELTCRWQALAGGKVLAGGESHVAAKPRSSVKASFPVTTGMDTLRLEFIHPDGRIVYVARLRANGYPGPAAPAALAASGPVRLSETDQNVTVQTAGTQLVLDKRSGQITSWRAGGQDVVLGGPILNLGESYPVAAARRGGGGGGGGARGRGPAPVSSTQPPQYRNVAVTANLDGPNAKLAVTADVYLTGSDELKAQLACTFNISPHAQADVTWNLAWKAADATAREAGLKFLLPAAMDRMSWFSDSLWTEYPPGHIASPQGSVLSKDASFSTNRRGVHWLSLSGAGNYSAVALNTSQPLHTHGRVDNNGVTLFLSSAIAPASRDSAGEEIRLTQAAPLTGGFRLRVASNATTAASSVSTSDSPFAAPVPVAGDTPVPVDRLRLGNANVFPMTGTWRFRLEHGASPAVKGELPADTPVPDFATPDASDASWTNILVPANWEIEGFSIPTYQERPVTSHDIGLYRRWVDIPANFAGQTVLWHFDGAYDGAEVFVNGQRCGYHESGFTAFNMDVTKAIKAGQRNLMAVRLYKDTSSASLDHGDFWCLGGISRETYLVALPPLHVEDLTVVTDLDAQYKDATLKSTLRVAGPAGAHFILSGELYSLDGVKVAIPAASQAGDIGPDGSATVVLSAPVTAPKLWSAEKPNLYYVFYRLADGSQTVERVQDRIGFRKIELKNGVVQVNGVPVKFTGVCRHDEFLTLGHALDEACWKADIALMKNANVSAIRTAHYNHAARFLELCDEAGFYVLDEVPSCWVASEIRNPERTWAYVFRSKETLARDKNRACVVVWSCGNESSYGVNNQAEFDYMKAHDPTRLALISQVGPGPNPRTDFDDFHYPPIPSIKAMITNSIRARVPAIYTEIGGVEDPWGQILFDNWAPIWSSDGITGAFIWEWQEQNIIDKFPERWPVNSPGARPTDRTTGLRPSGGGGAVTADRQIKPNRYFNLKMVYSPVITAAREIEPAGAVNQDGRSQCVVPIQNRYSFTDLADLTCRYQLLAGEKALAGGESHVAAKPRSTVDAVFPFLSGMDTLRLEFIHPDGRSIYATRLRVKGYQGPAAPAALPPAGPVRLSDTDQTVTVQTAGTQLVLDKRTGQIASWRAGDQNVVLGGPILNLGESNPAGGTPRVGGGTAIGPGGRGGRGAAPVSSAQPPEYHNVAVTARMEGANAKISVTADVYLTGSEELKGQLTYTLDISPDAQADLTWNLAWKAADATAREAGLKFLLPAATDRMSWFSDSLWTEYPADHIASVQGSATSKDIAFSSSRRDVRWLGLSGAGNYGIVALAAGKPLHTHGRVDNNGIMLFLSSGIASTGRDVTGDDIRLTQATPLAGGFRLRVALNAQ
jgi:beta-galactosidase